jgi:hypothetical protein
VPRFLRILLRLLVGGLLLLLLVAAAWWATHRDEVRGLRAALVVATELEQVPVASRIARWGTDEPRPTVVRTAGDLPATLTRPADGDNHPAVVLLVPNGTTEAEGTDLGKVQRGLARAGFAAWAVRAPDPGEGLGTAAGQLRLEAALQAVSSDPSTTGRGISIIAAGPLASQALVAAGDEKVGRLVRGVVAVQPVADLRGVVQLAVTGVTVDADGTQRRHPAADGVRGDAGRAIVDVLRTHISGGSGAAIDAALDAAAASDDPIAALRQLPAAALPPQVAQVRAVLDASDVGSFARAWEALPADLRADADAISPTAVAARTDARVLLVVPRRDEAWPGEDADRLAAMLDDARLVTTDVLDSSGATGDISVDDAREVGEALGWWLDGARG